MSPSGRIPDCARDLLPSLDGLRAWAVGVLGLDGELVYANPGLRALLGGESPERGRVEYLVNPDFAKLVASAANAGDSELVFEGLLTTGDGRYESHTAGARIWRCERYLLISAEHDVEELDRLNWELVESNRRASGLQRELLKKNLLLEGALEKLKLTQAMLVHAEKMNALGQLVAGVAHEIHNPLSLAVSNLHSLKQSLTAVTQSYAELETPVDGRSDGRERAKEIRKKNDLDFAFHNFPGLLEGVDQGLDRIAAMVRHLRSFSRPVQAERATIDLGAALEEVVDLAAGSLREGQVRVAMSIANPLLVECCAPALNQVFMNLVLNATQAMEYGGTLSIKAQSVDDDWIEIRFGDTGPGIPEENLGRIFDPFFTTKPVGAGGTGLGLSLAYKIVTEDHGGELSVRSVLGEGTEFRIRLPRVLSPDRQDESRSPVK